MADDKKNPGWNEFVRRVTGQEGAPPSGPPPPPPNTPAPAESPRDPRLDAETVLHTADVLRNYGYRRHSEDETVPSGSINQPSKPAPKAGFSMSRDDTIFWIGITALGAGLYLMAEHPAYGLALIAAGIAALIWANRGHMPRPSVRFVILIAAILAVAAIAGYDIYDRRSQKPAVAPACWDGKPPPCNEQPASFGFSPSVGPIPRVQSDRLRHRGKTRS